MKQTMKSLVLLMVIGVASLAFAKTGNVTVNEDTGVITHPVGFISSNGIATTGQVAIVSNSLFVTVTANAVNMTNCVSATAGGLTNYVDALHSEGTNLTVGASNAATVLYISATNLSIGVSNQMNVLHAEGTNLTAGASNNVNVLHAQATNLTVGASNAAFTVVASSSAVLRAYADQVAGEAALATGTVLIANLISTNFAGEAVLGETYGNGEKSFWFKGGIQMWDDSIFGSYIGWHTLRAENGRLAYGWTNTSFGSLNPIAYLSDTNTLVNTNDWVATNRLFETRIAAEELFTTTQLFTNTLFQEQIKSNADNISAAWITSVSSLSNVLVTATNEMHLTNDAFSAALSYKLDKTATNDFQVGPHTNYPTFAHLQTVSNLTVASGQAAIVTPSVLLSNYTGIVSIHTNLVGTGTPDLDPAAADGDFVWDSGNSYWTNGAGFSCTFFSGVRWMILTPGAGFFYGPLGQSEAQGPVGDYVAETWCTGTVSIAWGTTTVTNYGPLTLDVWPSMLSISDRVVNAESVGTLHTSQIASNTASIVALGQTNTLYGNLSISNAAAITAQGDTNTMLLAHDAGISNRAFAAVQALPSITNIYLFSARDTDPVNVCTQWLYGLSCAQTGNWISYSSVTGQYVFLLLTGATKSANGVFGGPYTAYPTNIKTSFIGTWPADVYMGIAVTNTTAATGKVIRLEMVQ